MSDAELPAWTGDNSIHTMLVRQGEGIRYDPDAYERQLDMLTMVDPELIDALRVDEWLMHDTDLPATDAQRIETLWKASPVFADLFGKVYNLVTRGTSFESALSEGASAYTSRAERRVGAKTYARNQDIARASVHPTFYALDTRVGLHAKIRAYNGIRNAFCINYARELPAAVAEGAARDFIDDADLAALFGLPDPSLTVGQAVDAHRRLSPPDLSEATLTVRCENMLRTAQVEAVGSVMMDLYGMVVLGEKRGALAKTLAERYMSEQADSSKSPRKSLLREDLAGTVEILKALAGEFKGYGNQNTKVFSMQVLKTFPQRYTLYAKQLEDIADHVLTVYEALGYALPPSLASCAELRAARQRAAAPRPQTPAPVRPARPETAAIDPARVKSYVAQAAALKSWTRTKKQRQQPGSDFSQLERLLVSGDEDDIRNLVLPGISKGAAAAVVGVLMELDGLANVSDIQSVRQTLAEALQRQDWLAGELRGIGTNVLARANSGTVPGVPDIAGCIAHVCQSWAMIDRALKQRWPGTGEGARVAGRLEAVLFDEPSSGEPHRLAAPLAGLVELHP